MNDKASPMAIASLVLAITSFICGLGWLTSLPGAIIGKMELNKIASGESSAAGETLAKIGFFASLVNLALYGLAACGGCLWVFLGGGLAMVQRMM